jgi:hypothetical protein
MNPYNFKPPLQFGTVRSGSTEEVIKRNHPHMYDYMKVIFKYRLSIYHIKIFKQ